MSHHKEMVMDDHKIKIVILGGGGVGKSALTVQYTSGYFIKRYDPTIEETYNKTIDIDNHTFVLEIVDTAGTEQFSAMRDLYIKTGHGFLLVFSVVSTGTLIDVTKMQYQITKVKDTDQVALVLVGNKCDLDEKREVTFAEAQEKADKLTHGKYVETSAKAMLNVEKIFTECAKEVIRYNPSLVAKPKKSKRDTCTLF